MHILREENEKANELAHIALIYKLNKSKFIKIIHCQAHLDLVEVRGILCISLKNVTSDPDDW